MHRSRILQGFVVVGMAGIWLAGAGGCSSLKVPPSSSALPSPPSITRLLGGKEPVVAPNTVAAVWTNAVFEQEGSRATRGFGGRVSFYGSDQKNSVRVDGRLTVYAYDELSPKTEDAAPDRKYVFTREQLEKHYGKGPTGPSYHIWIPWDAAGSVRREIALIVRFDPVEGKPVVGEPIHAVLQGPGEGRRRVSVSNTVPETIAASLRAAAEAPSSDDTESTGTTRPQTVRRPMEITTLNLPRHQTRWQAVLEADAPASRDR